MVFQIGAAKRFGGVPQEEYAQYCRQLSGKGDLLADLKVLSEWLSRQKLATDVVIERLEQQPVVFNALNVIIKNAIIVNDDDERDGTDDEDGLTDTPAATDDLEGRLDMNAYF